MFVYKITNKINGKSYVGITIRTVEQRFKEHCRRGGLLTKAIEKYGEEQFTVEVLAEAFDEAEMKWLEEKFIEKLNTTTPNGYNISPGGEHIGGLERTSEHREKIRQAITGIKRSEETKRKISLAKRDPGEETREKISAAAKLRGKPIFCFETGMTYRSTKICAEELNLDPPTITKVLKGKQKSTKGYTFKYVNEGDN